MTDGKVYVVALIASVTVPFILQWAVEAMARNMGIL